MRKSNASGAEKENRLLKANQRASPRRSELLLGTERPVLKAHLHTVAFSAPCGSDRVLAPALETYLEEQPALLRNLFFCCVGDWHLVLL